MTKIGVVSDTHGQFDEILDRLFRGVDAIIHAGDVCSRQVLEALERIAPVLAISGNCDQGLPTGSLPSLRLEKIDSTKILVMHDLFSSKRLIERHSPEIVISGHSHAGKIHEEGGVLYLNPGSAGPKRFKLLRSAAILLIEPDAFEARLFSLESPDTPEVARFNILRTSMKA